MDKFLIKVETEPPAPSATPGLELLINPLKHKRRQDDDMSSYGNLPVYEYEQNLERFRSFLSYKIENFKPHTYSDPIDYMLEGIWFHFLFHEISASAQPTTIEQYRNRENSDTELISNIE